MMAFLASAGILAHMPMLSIGGGVLSAGLGVVGGIFRSYRFYFIAAAIVAGFAALATFPIIYLRA